MEYKLKDIVTFKPGYAFKKSDMTDAGIDLVKIGNLKNNKVIVPSDVKIKEDIRFKDFIINKNDILMALTGDPVYKGSIQTWVGRTSKYLNDEIAYLNQRVCKLIPNEKIVYGDYLYYWLIRYDKTYEIAGLFHGSANQANISHKEVGEMIIDLPSLDIQRKVSKILSDIDKKINLNNKINNNLLEQIKSIYNEVFTQYDEYKRLDEISNVTIGKTPPRSEQECFTTDKKDIKWISISDLGKSGMFIFDTSEKLTREAVDKYNVKVIPKDTVILSFKLTVGRTGFTTEDMTTNEAIAHFDLNNKELNNYLYCYLTYFNYSDLGSTSSIATAINSKIVKSIKIGIPSKEQLYKFNKLTSSMFNLVKNNEKENIKLSELRDTLLPKLMNGEIDLDNIEI